MTAAPPGYDALRHGLAWADLGRRSVVSARGPDAPRFIENFATASVIGLTPGQGTETFFTDARGWVLALAVALRDEDGLVLDAEPGLGERLCDHLEHYHIRERVELADVSADHAAVLVAGPAAEAWLVGQSAPAPADRCAHAAGMLGGVAVCVMRTDWWGVPGWIARCAATDHSRLVAWLRTHDAVEAAPAAIEAARIEGGTPHPIDIREKTLPQELGRDARAICFTKGCYLGQETVARLDALGHVNRRLAAVAVDGSVQPGAEVRCAGEPCGTLTSACHSPRLGCGLGLGLLSTKAAAGGRLEVDGAAGRIVEVPA